MNGSDIDFSIDDIDEYKRTGSRVHVLKYVNGCVCYILYKSSIMVQLRSEVYNNFTYINGF